MTNLTTVIADAIVCLPFDLCRITADYATILPHSWTSQAGNVDVVLESDNQTRLTASAVICACRSADDGWRIFASTVPLVVGHLNWTVEVDWPISAFGAGVTLRPGNSFRIGADYNDAATADDWILFPVVAADWISAYNGRSTVIPVASVDRFRRLRIRFAADAVNGNVVVDLFGSEDCLIWKPTLSTISIVSGIAAVDFADLRPCVVNGVTAMQAVIRSDG